VLLLEALALLSKPGFVGSRPPGVAGSGPPPGATQRISVERPPVSPPRPEEQDEDEDEDEDSTLTEHP
jgi:hypothetical protein